MKKKKLEKEIIWIFLVCLSLFLLGFILLSTGVDVEKPCSEVSREYVVNSMCVIQETSLNTDYPYFNEVIKALFICSPLLFAGGMILSVLSGFVMVGHIIMIMR